MKYSPYRTSMLHRLVLAVSWLCVLGWSWSAWASPPLAGTAIQNTASATFVDSTTGLSVRLSSNTVQVLVMPLEACTITANQTMTRVPGSVFALPHTLTNTGNTPETCAVTVTLASGSAFTPQKLQIVEDLNGNGVVDSSDPVISDAGITLAPGASINVLVSGSVPSTASSEQAATLLVSASSSVQHHGSSNTDTVIAVSGPVLNVTKSASTSNPVPGTSLTYTLSVSNVGSSAANGIAVTVDGAAQELVLLSDGVPANTTFQSLGVAGSATRLFHRMGDGANAYVSSPPPGSVIDGIAWGVPSLAVGTTISGQFTVRVNSNASGSLNNTAYADYLNSGSVTSTPSNPVQLVLPSLPAQIAFYTGSDYGTTMQVGSYSSPLYVQTNAAACNTNPDQVMTYPVRLTSQLSHDVETFNAVETAPNSGLFRIQPNVPTANAQTRAVVPGDGVLELLPNDTVTATFLGCSTAGSVSATLVISPVNVIYDSKSNLPVAGATVSLVAVGGPSSSTLQGEVAGSLSVVTGVNGDFSFPMVPPGTYQIKVTPPTGYVFPSKMPSALQPADRVINVTGSYGQGFAVAAPGLVRFDVPVDAAATGGLIVEKTVSQASAEPGDFVDYLITVSNHSGIALNDVQLNDWLPAGFAYMKGSSRLQGAPVADPKRAAGAMGFSLGTLANNAQRVLSYRVSITPSAQSGNGINSAQAQSGSLRSNMASVAVQLLDGIFTDKAILIGKVYADCNGNRVQDANEPGIPGVRVWLADGTYAITDGQGKYSLYALTPRTTVAAIDPSTLPPDATLEVLDHRNAFDPSSKFVDLQNGELHRADFAIRECSAAILADIAGRRKALDQPSEIVQGSKSLLNALQTNTATQDQRTLPASGTLGPNGVQGVGQVASASANPMGMPAFGSNMAGAMPLGAVGDMGGSVAQQSPATRPLFPTASGHAPDDHVSEDHTSDDQASDDRSVVPKAPVVPLQDKLSTLDPGVGFVDLVDGQIMPGDQTRVQVKGPQGATLQLSVDGKDIGASQVGLRASLASHGITAWEYVGVNLRPGDNHLVVTATDPFGNKRGSASITLRAPGPLAVLHIVLPTKATADTKTPAMITVQPVDANGLPVITRLPLTLSSSQGIWQVKDLNPSEPGTQVFVEGDDNTFPLLPPANPGTAEITVASGSIEAEAKLEFMPNLRPMFGVGVVEGVLNLSKLDPHSIQPTQSTDAFETAISSASDSFDDGKATAAARTQIFLKGKVLGSTLLTLGYDSDKPSDTELFRDIQPNQYYPVYGDSSVKGFDAQSTGKLYVRLDHGTSYVLLGDYSTQSDNPARQLTQYTRALNGFKAHGQDGGLVVDTFASHTTSTQVVVEIQGNGTSGPYQLDLNGVINSQQVDLITRDRNQPGVVISDKPMTPFVDYSIENYTGRLLFAAPVPAVDSNLDPVFIRVTYEVNAGGPKHWVGGLSAQYQITPWLNIGGTGIADEDPANRIRLDGANMTMKLGAKSTLVAEAAQSDTDEQGRGDAGRLEWRVQGLQLQGRVWAIRTDDGFYNPSSLDSAGQSQYGIQMAYLIDPKDRIAVEGLRSAAPGSIGSQTGITTSWQRTLPGNMKLSVGVRHADGDSTTTAPSSNDALPGSTPVDFTSTYARIESPVPYVPDANVFTQYEHALNESAQVASVGGTYQLGNAGKLYMTHESSNSLSGSYGLNPTVNQYSTVFGFQTALADKTQVFNEYRIGDSIDGRAAEDAVGLRHMWQLEPGLGVSASAERIHPVDGQVTDESTALTTAISYTASETWKASARVEWRESDTSRSWLVTSAIATKLDDNWTLLNRGLYSTLQNSGAATAASTLATIATATANSAGSGPGTQLLGQYQGGFAYRPSDNDVWNAIGMIGYKRDLDTTLPVGEQTDERAWMMISQVNVQPAETWDVSARYGIERMTDMANGIDTSGWTQLVGARVIHDIGERWDIGAQAYATWGSGTRNDAVGVEVGYLLQRNLWVSVGYNVLGFHDPDLSGGAYTDNGIYLRLRFKFGADLFDQIGSMHAPAGNKANATNAAAALGTGTVQGGG